MQPCAYCGEQLAEDSTVCPFCGAFEPFSAATPGAYAAPEQPGTENAREGLFKGTLRDVGCNCAVGCGSLLAVGVIAVVAAVIAVFCGGSVGDYGYDPETQEVNCQEYLDADVSESADLLWGDDEVEVFSIRATLKKDRVDWDKQVCPGIAETSGGKYEIWYFVIDKDKGEWNLGYEMRPLKSAATPIP